MSGRRIGSSTFVGTHPFPDATSPLQALYSSLFAAKWSTNGRLEDVISKRLAQGHKGQTAKR